MVKRTLMATMLVVAMLAWGCSSDDGTENPTPGNDAVEVQEDNGGNGGQDVLTGDEGTNSGTDVPVTGDNGNPGGNDVADVTPGDDTGHDVPAPPEACKEADLPTSWGGATILYYLQLVDSSDADAMKVCADFNDDGTPDNGFGSFASMANGYLKDDGSLTNQAGVMLEFVDVTDYANTAQFTMNGLFGKLKALDDNKDAVASKTDCNEMYVDPKSYAMQDGKCAPLLSFKSAKIENGEFDSGVSTFGFAIPVQGLLLNLTVTDAHITGKVVNNAGETGFALENGVLTGYLLKTDIDAALDAAQDYCDNADPQPDACNYLSLIPTLLTYDLDMDDDGEPDAVSLCVTFYSVKAKIVDYVPQQD